MHYVKCSHTADMPRSLFCITFFLTNTRFSDISPSARTGVRHSFSRLESLLADNYVVFLDASVQDKSQAVRFSFMCAASIHTLTNPYQRVSPNPAQNHYQQALTFDFFANQMEKVSFFIYILMLYVTLYGFSCMMLIFFLYCPVIRLFMSFAHFSQFFFFKFV